MNFLNVTAAEHTISISQVGRDSFDCVDLCKELRFFIIVSLKILETGTDL